MAWFGWSFSGGLDQPLVVEPELGAVASASGWHPGMPKLKLRPPSARHLARRAWLDGHTRPEVRAKRAEGARKANLYRQIEREIAALA